MPRSRAAPSPTSWPRWGVDAVDAICDLLLAEDLRVNQVTPGPWSRDAPRLRRPSGGHGGHRFHRSWALKPSPRTYGSYPRILGQFVRDEQRLSLEEAVRKMTSAPAARLGLARPGAPARRAGRGPRGLRPGARPRPTPPMTSRARSPTASSSSRSTGSWWWTAGSRPGHSPDAPCAHGRDSLP